MTSIDSLVLAAVLLCLVVPLSSAGEDTLFMRHADLQQASWCTDCSFVLT